MKLYVELSKELGAGKGSERYHWYKIYKNNPNEDLKPLVSLCQPAFETIFGPLLQPGESTYVYMSLSKMENADA